MNEEKFIKKIADSFKIVLEEIFNFSERRDFVNMIFTPGYEDVVYGRINEYFDNQNKLYPQDRIDLEKMQDGVNNLIERIHESDLIMKVLFYLAIFSNENDNKKEIEYIFGL